MKMTAGLQINCPVDQVFAFVVNMEHLPRWARGVVAARRTTSGPEGVGTTYQITGRLLGREIGSTYELTAYAPPTSFAATGAIGPFPLREVYTFTPAQGAPRFTWSARWSRAASCGYWRQSSRHSSHARSKAILAA
jgi:hypothetical protein